MEPFATLACLFIGIVVTPIFMVFGIFIGMIFGIIKGIQYLWTSVLEDLHNFFLGDNEAL
jgi:ABC-type dipeptide/oligopeptide/nickel transport system permease subunit